MRHGRRWMVGLTIAAAVLMSACAKVAEEEEESGNPPATVEPIEGTDEVRVILTEEAADRLGLRSENVTVQASGTKGTSMTVIPYSALFYGPSGDTWTYVSTEPLTFERAAVDIDHIDGDLVFLSEGPPSGTSVVTQGAAELFGTETGVDE